MTQKPPHSQQVSTGKPTKIPSFGSWSATACITHFAASVAEASWMESKANSYYMGSHSEGKHIRSRRTLHLSGDPALQSEFGISILYMFSV